jgi:nitrite reductase/ring-hydroxylating ferredoxin subunit
LPSGWFVVATSDELPAGATLTTTFMAEELVLYRTASGEARAVSPFCPHLGAHLGRCGTVVGETIRCDFHHFRFGADGGCVGTGYGTKPPPSARLAVRHLLEQNGLILVHHDHEGRAPTWTPPLLDERGWSPLVRHRFSLRGHPQETTENSVDIGHFSAVHGYSDVRVLRDLRTEGPYLHARYAMRRAAGPLGRWGVRVSTEFDVHLYGLGYSFVEVEVVPYGVRLRHFVFSTPTEPDRIDLRIAVSVLAPFGDGIMSNLVGRPFASTLANIVGVMYVNDVGQDVRFWEHKQYVPRPALAEGDGPVAGYRRWASQFYASLVASTAQA